MLEEVLAILFDWLRPDEDERVSRARRRLRWTIAIAVPVIVIAALAAISFGPASDWPASALR